MNISENIARIKEGKDDIIKSLKNKGVEINDNTLINEIPTIIDNAEIGGGGGDTPSVPTELVQKYEGATVFRINVPTDNYEFAINLCNDATKATYDVDWGDGSLESGLTTDEQHHIYSKSGTYDVNIYNISKDITLGGSYNITFGSNYNDYSIIYYLFNNTNNNIWSGTYIENKDYICTNILIGKGIKSIGINTFNGCTSLTSITTSDSITSIESSAFFNCTSLTSVTIPEGVTSIGDSAFQGCSSLQSITIPEGVTSIGTLVFQDCFSLQSITILEGVTSIGNQTFRNCSSLQSITIPKGVTSIGNQSFQDCKKLQSITIPEGVTSIGTLAFQGCSSLQSITIPKGVTSIGNQTFNSCSSLQSITIPEGVTSIGSNAFGNCTSLQSITCLNPTPSTIQSSSFPTSSFNYSKRYLYVPKESTGYDSGNFKTYLIDKGWELRYIEDYEKTPTTLKLKTKNNFFHNLQAIGQANLINYELVDDEYIYNFDNKITELIQYTFYNNVLKEIELPEGVTTIDSYAFQSCSNLTSVTIPDSVTTIGSYAFQSCSNLTSVTIPDSVTTIGSYAFSSCKSLQSIVIPDSVTTIGSYAFSSCKSLQSIVIPDSVTTIGSYAFSSCSNLTSVTIPDSVTTIGSYAFNNCNSLQSVNIPNNVTTINERSFYGCSSLQSIELPTTLTSIGSTAFYGCSFVESITCKAMVAPTIKSDTFHNVGLQVPSGTKKVLRVPEGAEGYEAWKSKLSGFTIEYIPIDEL